jgi:DNA-binding response OmpR family regulator
MTDHSIVIVDDDNEAAGILQTYLQDYFTKVDYFDNGYNFLDHVKAGNSYDLLLLDIKMPAISGTETYKELIKIKDIPTIFVSSVTDPADKVTCLEFGAVDYIVKPFYLREVLARIKNAIKNTSNNNQQNEDNSALTGFEFSGWVLNTTTEILTTPGKEEIPLTKGLFTLLNNFVSNPGRILTREQLMDSSESFESFDRAVDAQISNLRKCFKKHDPDNKFIQTKHGSGYYFDSKVKKLS